jgi:hypothetical protein
MSKQPKLKPDEYHLIDITVGESHGGFVSLEAARLEARELRLAAWEVFHGNLRVERHDPAGAGEC